MKAKRREGGGREGECAQQHFFAVMSVLMLNGRFSIGEPLLDINGYEKADKKERMYERTQTPQHKNMTNKEYC